MADLFTFSPDAVVATFDGVILENFSDSNTAITLTPEEDSATTKVGIKGVGVASYSSSNAYTIELEMFPYGDDFAALLNKEQLLRSGQLAAVSFVLADTSTGETYSAAKTIITKRPVRSFGKEIQPVTWTLWTPCLTVTQTAFTL